MRRVVTTGMLLAALASGCGGGSDRAGDRPAVPSVSQGSAATAIPQAGDGRLGSVVVAQPGKTTTRGRVQKITGRLALPQSNKRALGAEDNCPDVDVQPTPSNIPHVSDVIFCLMNAMRTDAGVPALRQQDQLAQASAGHSQDMEQNKYFAHDSQDGRDLVTRLTQIGYIPKTGDWVVGENLAWGSGSLATPQAIVNAWMNSPEHKANLLSGDFVEVGMGVVYGTPSTDAPDGITVTTDFGTRPGSTQAGASSSATSTPSTSTSTSASGSSGSGAVAAVRRKRALELCAHRRGRARRRCVHAARRIR